MKEEEEEEVVVVVEVEVHRAASHEGLPTGNRDNGGNYHCYRACNCDIGIFQSLLSCLCLCE